jgi:serine/threonine protein kinase
VNEGLPTEEFGPYLVYEQLGMGGMAEVHRAVAKGADVRRPVALKRMLAHIASNEEMVQSFVRESRLASYLRHQNVPQTYDLGRVGDVYFIVMELITGRNLREVLKHCARTTGPMSVPIALNILNQICAALDYAHNLCSDTGEPLGIIHRDVSPSNVIVAGTGVVKLIDFGVAKVSGAGMQTVSGTLKGKFAYMAPEYIAGQIDARADLFAVGVIAHELLTNRPLFSGRDDVDTVRRVRGMQIDPPSKKNPQVPPEIDDIVMTALARDPDRRWQHATALSTALTTLTRRLGLVATNTQVVQWLDWAFTHEAGAPEPRAHLEPGTRTELDAERISDAPSISLEGSTAQLLAINQVMTLVTPGSAPSPPVITPAGTPPYASTQIADHGSGPVATILDSALGPSAAPSPVAAPPPQERPAATVLGTSAPPPRAGRLSSPPALSPNATPMSAALMAHLQAAQALAGPGGHANAAPTPAPAGNAAPVRTTPGLPAPAPVAPTFPVTPWPPQGNVAPLAIPQAQAPTSAPSPYDAAQFAVMQGASGPPAVAHHQSRRWLAVIVVVVAAATSFAAAYAVLRS